MSQKSLRTLSPTERLFFVLATLFFLLLPLIAFVILARQTAAQITLTVYAAESLREALVAHARDFEAQQPRVRLDLRFMSAAEAGRQVERGVPIDLLILPESYRVLERARYPEVATQFVAFLQSRGVLK
ncbi:MAG: substrate-binding domain-containing protein [Anaerolineae bacterium]|nr:substrate-binding domain-containing protein [Anaerolineae bacterium]MDW8299566.1 substrate-binding domain-containing protein [Anaerolineae bacterium]